MKLRSNLEFPDSSTQGIAARLYQSVAYSSTVTLNAALGTVVLIGPLTGDLIVANPTSPVAGQALLLYFVQDGTGGHAVNWGTHFPNAPTVPTAAGTACLARFVYDGTDWQNQDTLVGVLYAAENLNDLSDKAAARANLSLGTAALLDGPASGNAASGEVVKGSDTRLTNSRAPTGSAGGDLTGTYPNPTLSTSGVTAGSYTNASVTFDAKGRATAASSGTGGGTAWQTLTDGATISWAGGSGNGAQVTLAGNRTLANATGLTGGQTYSLRVIQDGTGSRTLSYGNAYYFPYGAPPRLSTAASAADVLLFSSDGTNLYLVADYANTRATAFDPSAIANCTLWLKADAISASDGDALGTWTDSSGNSHDMTQATAGKKPIYHTNKRNGLPAVTFDNSDDTMSGSLSIATGAAFTVFAVFSQATGGSNRRVLQGSNNWLLGQNQGGRWSYYNTGMAFAPEYVIAGQWACLCATQAAAGRGNLYLNSVPMAVSDAAGGPGTVWLGAGGAFAESADGDVGEILIYTRQITQAEMRDVHTYLLRKWGIGLAV